MAPHWQLVRTGRFTRPKVGNAVVTVWTNDMKSGDWSRVRILLGQELTRGQQVSRLQFLPKVEGRVEGERNQRKVAFVELDRVVGIVDDVDVIRVVAVNLVLWPML